MDLKRFASNFVSQGSRNTSGSEESPSKRQKQGCEENDPKPRKKRDRFPGTTEEEVMTRTLPDILQPGLDIVIIGINPGLTAAYVGHHYAGPGNHFWKCVHESGITSERLTAREDQSMPGRGIGFTNIVSRTTRSSADLSPKEIAESVECLVDKLRMYRPRIAAFNGKGIYEIFCKRKIKSLGTQPEKISGTDTHIFVMPSSSARCSQLPRAADKLPFYRALMDLRDALKEGRPPPPEQGLVMPPAHPRRPRGDKANSGNAEDSSESDRSEVSPSKCVYFREPPTHPPFPFTKPVEKQSSLTTLTEPAIKAEEQAPTSGYFAPPISHLLSRNTVTSSDTASNYNSSLALLGKVVQEIKHETVAPPGAASTNHLSS